MSKPSKTPATSDAACTACLRLGWTMIAVFLVGGVVLEAFHLVKLPLYVDARLRRELWTLAHAHGTLLGVINVIFALTASRHMSDDTRRARAAALLRFGTPLVPLGFFLGGIGSAEGDPSVFIVLVPVGALLAAAAVAMLALDLGRSRLA
ncbi:MAG: hypothetical protein U0610_30550 [bacterium]